MGFHFSSEEFSSQKNKVITKLKEEKIDALVRNIKTSHK